VLVFAAILLVLVQMVKNERRRQGFDCGNCGSCAIFCVSDSGGGGCDYVGRAYDVFCHGDDAVFSWTSLIFLTSECVE
jgi:hypothetical protein